ncbi:hypothetical protein ZYGR_0I02010 [Zygosaccharomyces rouxii]|uniref:ZYRO0C04686p n=2 Tax=Zygosaccharomyces rouxii TaxID=4956 RepID=C5DT18_ZYGRC|nr:uncharacterized protein ZYRO0C04686g [Zygosaccharomyces rouxii]KAH9201882.1 hypothetical protein LQ764DRAFT_233581 [Zygosaccharomyces rouxii]GAV47905.1 hypothetical protein ZYGR_0I02010 [Zygosaccharomyces rouxii]CAR26929.1 ZYRO0C04686p [Zygosaccharomyces rouxii]
MVSHEEETEPLVTKPVDKEEEAPSRREEAAVVKEGKSTNEDKPVTTETDPQQQQGFSSQHIHSIKTEYDENPLLSINKPTSAPHNTPVQSPPTSPGSGINKDKDNKLSTASTTSQTISSSLPRLPPLPVPVSASRPDATDGGTEPPNIDHVVSPGSNNGAADTATASAGTGTEEKQEEEGDSPISIINRRNIFATSDSRSSSASKQVAGPPAKEHLKTNSEEGNSSSSNSNSQGGVAPQSFYFDKDRSVTDPHVKHESNDQKINISNWRHGADNYSLIEGANSNTNVNESGGNSNEGEGEGSGDRSRSNSRSSPRGSETNGPAKISNGLNSSPHATNDDDDNYVPPPPPRYINSKLDDIRSRLLLNPRTVSPRSDEDMDKTHAAAVLSNMRSSPFRLSDRPASLSSSRPGSSSFSGKGYARPVIRIHHREEPSGDQDDNAVLDDDDEEEEDEEDEDENGNERLRHSSTSRVVPAPTPARRKEVTWNKNGKRVSRRLSAPETRRTKTKKIKIEPGKDTTNARSRDSSIPRNGAHGEEVDDTYSSHEVMENEEEEEEYEEGKNGNRGQSKKNSMGSRSRTGCWICRLRKKKCTEERPRCYNCDRLNLTCYYDVIKPDFVSNPQKKQMKLEEIKRKTKEAKRNAMRKKPGANP